MPVKASPTSAASARAPAPAVPQLPTRRLGTSTQLTSGSTMKAFPGVCQIAGTSNLLVTFRDGTDDSSNDGVIYKMVLTPHSDGTIATVSGPTLLFSAITSFDQREGGLLALANGTILYLDYKEKIGSSTAADFSLRSRISSDGGVTWSAPTTLTNLFAFCPGTGGQPVQTSDGTVYYAAHGVDTLGGHAYVRLYKSTDSGVTFVDGGTIVPLTASWDYQEPCLEVGSDGMSLICAMRVIAPSAASDGTTKQGWVTTRPQGEAWGNLHRVFDTEQKPQLCLSPDGDLICNPAIPSAWSVGGSLGDYIQCSGDFGNTWSPHSFETSLTAIGTRRYGAFCRIAAAGLPYNVAFLYACGTGAGFISDVFWIPVGKAMPFGSAPQVVSATSLSALPWQAFLLNSAAPVTNFQVWVAMSDEGYVTLGGQITPGASNNKMIELPNQGLGWAPQQDHIDSAKGIKVDTLGFVWNTNANTNPIVLDGIRFKANAP